MKYLLITLCLLTASCSSPSVTERCTERAVSQYLAAVRQYGFENAQLWQLELDKPVRTKQGTFTHHLQAKVRPGGPETQWKWLDNHWITTYVSTRPQPGCTPCKRLK